MRKFTVQFEMLEGSDEFWDLEPKPAQVLHMIDYELQNMHPGIYIENVKIVKVEDTNVYDKPEDWELK